MPVNTGLAILGSLRCAGSRGVHADHLRRSLLLDVVEASRRRLLRSSAWRRGGDPARHADRRRYRVRRTAGLDPAGAADELGDLSGRRHPVRQPARGRVVGDPSERHADGRGRHHDRHAGRAASGGFQPAAVCARQGAADRPRRVVAGGRRRRRLRAAVEIHRAVLRAGDPDLAGRRSQAAALADLALALSRRARRAGCCLRRSFSGTPIITGYPSSSRWGGRGSRISARSSSPN